MPLPLLAWSLTLAALIHIFEEFVFPGGFTEWWFAYRPQIAPSVTKSFLVMINTVLVVFSAAVAVAAQAPRGNGVAAWLTLAALLAGTPFSTSSARSKPGATHRVWFQACFFTFRWRFMVIATFS
jgi:hypothetical protein